MNQLKVFENDLFRVSAKVESGQVMFDVEEVARNLGITTINKGIHYVRWNRVNSYLPKDLPQVAKGDFIPEPLVYKIAFKASNEIAEKFQDWLAIEVIPSIRKTGSYEMDKPSYMYDDPIKRAERWIIERKEYEQLEQQRKEELPYTNFGKAVSNSDAAINVGSFSKMVYDDHGIKLGRNKMFKWLRENGYLIKHGRERNQPKQKYVEQGLFTTTVTMISRTQGDVESVTTLITGKGQVKLSEKLLQEFGVTT